VVAEDSIASQRSGNPLLFLRRPGPGRDILHGQMSFGTGQASHSRCGLYIPISGEQEIAALEQIDHEDPEAGTL
jgi:hypothetical protein